jgi:hypothetical protein
MNRGIVNVLIFAVLVTGCAVSANEFAPAPLPQFEPTAATIDERYEIQIANQSALSVNAIVLGNTCSAVDISGDFQERFGQILDQALAGVFTGKEGSGTTTISINIAPERPQVRMLRRSYVTGDARIDFAMAADVTVTRANGDPAEFHVSANTTRAQATEETATCDGGGPFISSGSRR